MLTTSMEAVDGSELCHYPPLTHSCWSRGSSCCAVTVSPSSPPSPRRPCAHGAGGCALRHLHRAAGVPLAAHPGADPLLLLPPTPALVVPPLSWRDSAAPAAAIARNNRAIVALVVDDVALVVVAVVDKSKEQERIWAGGGDS